MIDLGGGFQASASAINDAGQVVGNGTSGAFLYSGGRMTALGVPAGAISSNANAINGSGAIVGSIEPSSGASHAALYSAGVWTDLGAVSGAVSTQATSINTAGTIVGQAVFPKTGTYQKPIAGKRVAFVHRNGSLVDLNTLVPSGSGLIVGGNSAEGTVRINDAGQILCNATTAAGFIHAVLLTLN